MLKREKTDEVFTDNQFSVHYLDRSWRSAPHKILCVEVATYDQGGKVHQLVSAGPVMKLILNWRRLDD